MKADRCRAKSVWKLISFYVHSRRAIRGGPRREADRFHQNGMALGRGYSDEASIEGVEPTPGSTQPVSTARTGSWVHVEQLAGSDARYFLGNL